VKGEGMREADRSFTINTIDQERISAERWESPLNILEEVPGFDAVAYQHGGIADVFTIRGFTGGGHGSEAGMALDGISLNEGESHADGYGDTNIIIPLEIDHVQVFKGPVSPLYGNFARGGVVAFNTRKTGEYGDIDLSMGSFDTYDAQAAFGTNIDGLQINGALQGYESEGWRRHSRYTKMNAALRGAYQFGNSEIALSLRGHGGEWQGPNYIQHDQFSDKSRRRDENPFTQLQDDTGSKQLNSQRLDFFHNLSDDLKLLAFAYRTRSDFTRYQTSLRVLDTYPDLNALPSDFMDPNAAVNITDIAPQTEHVHGRDAMAFGTSLNGVSNLFGSDSSWVVGIEYYDEEAEVQRWDTVRRDRYNLREDNTYNIKTTSVYGQMDMNVHPRFRPTLGFRYDNFDGDRVNHAANDARTDMNSYDHFSPKLGVRSALTDTWELRASIANGFGLPGAQKYDPTADVDTIEIWQYEIGINGAPTPQWYLDLAAFMITSSDEIMRENPADANSPWINAGKTRRTGLEGEIRYFPAAVENLEVFTVFSLNDSEVKENANASLIGMEVQRLPEYIANIGVRYAPPVGFGGQIRLRSLGSWYTNATNTIEYDGYDVVNASLFYTFRADNGRNAQVYLDVNNIFDEVYSENVSGGPHPSQGNVPTSYSPRPPANAMVGFRMSL
ncbi:MAG: TonB-dependent receptor, partial [Gammaproteobacteria bacterium]|nr:TonB-dependent receptor [Gammaproteobacteria bacterium]